jgi:hypothetical protein
LREIGGPFSISGVTWLPEGQEKTLPATALRSNILCRDHNSFLSPLDDRVRQFFKELVSVEEHIRSSGEGVRLRLFNGHDLERWLLKVLLGLAASGMADHAAGDQGIQAMDYWVDILFHNKPFPRQHGLYVHARLGTEAPADNAAGMALVSNPQDGIYGLSLKLRDKTFMLPLKLTSGPLPPDSLLSQAMYRPSEFVAASKGVIKGSFMFTWDEDADPRAIIWDYAEPRV